MPGSRACEGAPQRALRGRNLLYACAAVRYLIFPGLASCSSGALLSRGRTAEDIAVILARVQPSADDHASARARPHQGRPSGAIEGTAMPVDVEQEVLFADGSWTW